MKKFIFGFLLLILIIISCSKEKFVERNEIRWVNNIDGIKCERKLEESDISEIKHIDMGEEILYIGYLNKKDKKTKTVTTVHKIKYEDIIYSSYENLLSLTINKRSNLSLTYQENIKTLKYDSSW